MSEPCCRLGQREGAAHLEAAHQRIPLGGLLGRTAASHHGAEQAGLAVVGGGHGGIGAGQMEVAETAEHRRVGLGRIDSIRCHQVQGGELADHHIGHHGALPRVVHQRRDPLGDDPVHLGERLARRRAEVPLREAEALRDRVDAERVGHASPSRRAALSRMMPARISSLRNSSTFSASSRQRSGVSSGKSLPNSTRFFSMRLA